MYASRAAREASVTRGRPRHRRRRSRASSLRRVLPLQRGRLRHGGAAVPGRCVRRRRRGARRACTTPCAAPAPASGPRRRGVSGLGRRVRSTRSRSAARCEPASRASTTSFRVDRLRRLGSPGVDARSRPVSRARAAGCRVRGGPDRARRRRHVLARPSCGSPLPRRAAPGWLYSAPTTGPRSGSPFHLSYRYVTDPRAPRPSAGLFGIRLPTLRGTCLVFAGNAGC